MRQYFETVFVCYRWHMLQSKTDARTFQIRTGDFGDAYAYVEGLLTNADVSDEASNETLLVFEALMKKLVGRELSEYAELEIAGIEKLGGFRIEIGFEGKIFVREESSADCAEDRVLDDYDDKLTYDYHSGFNTISISVTRGYNVSLLACAAAFLCAVVVYLLLGFLLDAREQHELLTNYVFLLETLYANIMLMVGAPMTFFSLLKNLTDTYVVSRRNSGLRRLQVQTLATSVLAMLLAFAVFLCESIALSNLAGFSASFGGSVNRTFAEVVTSLMPPSIFEPFEAISPIPLMGLAFLCTYALCSSGRYFDSLRHAMMACYTLFSRMLHVVIAMLPIFCFVAIMDVLLDSGFENLFEIVAYFVAGGFGLLVLLAAYAIRLRAHGVKVISFMRKLVPLLRENVRIGSAINAAPYNVRYCSKTFNMNRVMLKRELPVLAEINLDGNCFLLAFFTLAFSFATGIELSWLNFIGLAALILFLSLGAPNQPGSILIGMLIITMYLNSSDVICVAIYLESFFGIVQNAINVIGDIVMVAIEDTRTDGLSPLESKG